MTNLFITVFIPAEQHFISFKELLACLCVINVCSLSKFLNNSIPQDGRLISVHFVCLFVWLWLSLAQVNLCLLQVSVEEGSPSCSNKCVTHVSLVALCFDRIATQFRMNR